MSDLKTPEKKASDLLAMQAKEKAKPKEVEPVDVEPKEVEPVEVEIKEESVKATSDVSEEDKALLAELKANKETDSFADYQKFAELHFLMWDGKNFERKRIKKEALEQYDKLEKRFKAAKGNKPKKSNTVVLGLEYPNVRLVAGYAVPESLYKMFVETEKAEKYF